MQKTTTTTTLKRQFAALLMLVAVTVMQAQSVDTRTHIFDENVRSLKVSLLDNRYFPAIYVLGSDNPLLIEFDYADYDVHYLRYSVTHCNADWQPSMLVETEYVSGFNQADITEWAQSETTFMHYYNYNFTLPNAEMQLLKSGNYLLSVYEQDDPDKVLFQTRFSVSENTVGVYAEVTSRTDIDYNDAHQQLSFDITYKPGQVTDPYGEFTAVISQNTRTDNEVVVTRPQMVVGNRVHFENLPELIFPAGNEYRRFETVNLHSINMGVASIGYYEPFYHATLQVDEPRANLQYLYDKTQYGCFTIRNAESDYSSTESDYLLTHFLLDLGGVIDNGRIVLEGEFTHGLPLELVTMQYEPSLGCYTCTLPLKQGAYNYQYLWIPDGAQKGLTNAIDGDKYQTVNQYLIKVYDRPMGERYDHMVGFGIIYSGI